MPTVLSVGQCSYDDSRIGRLVKEATGAFLERAPTVEEAKSLLASKKYELILINRIFDANGDKGLDFLAQLKESGATTPIMLVSDYPDAQAAAVASGALPGFGKSALTVPEVGVKIRDAIESANAKAKAQD